MDFPVPSLVWDWLIRGFLRISATTCWSSLLSIWDALVGCFMWYFFRTFAPVDLHDPLWFGISWSGDFRGYLLLCKCIHFGWWSWQHIWISSQRSLLGSLIGLGGYLFSKLFINYMRDNPLMVCVIIKDLSRLCACWDFLKDIGQQWFPSLLYLKGCPSGLS